MVSKSPASRRKSKSSGKVQKFASKVVDKAISDLSSERIKEVKNPVATSKWLAKLRLSVLQKVSKSSQILFAKPGESVSELTAEVSSLKEQILLELSKLNKLAEEKLNATNFKVVPNQSLVDNRPGRFDEKTSRIGELFAQVAQQLTLVNSDVQSHVASLGGSVEAMRYQYEQILEESKSQTTASTAAALRKSKEDKKPIKVAVRKATTERILNHMNKE